MARRRRRKKRTEDRQQADLLQDAGVEVPDMEPQPELAAASGSEPEPGLAAAADPEPESEFAAAADPESEPEPDPEQSATPEPESEPSASAESVPAHTSEPDPELPPAAEPEQETELPEASPPAPTPSADWPDRVAALEDMRDVQGALDVVRAERARVPDDIPLLEAEVRILGTLGRFDAALEPLRELRRAAGDAPLVHLTAGLLHFRRGMYPEAEAELRLVTDSEEPAAQPYRGEANYYLGESLNRMERVEEALGILRTAIELVPDDPRPYNTLGRLLDRKGDPEEAALMHRRAREAERSRGRH